MIKQWFLKRGLRKHKEKAVYELQMDLQYIRSFKKQWLEYSEMNDRKRYTVLSKKEELNEAESDEFEKVKENISTSKATKNEYQKTLALLRDVQDYLTLLR